MMLSRLGNTSGQYLEAEWGLIVALGRIKGGLRTAGYRN